MSLSTATRVWKQPNNVLRAVSSSNTNSSTSKTTTPATSTTATPTTRENRRPTIDKKDFVTFRFFLDSIESATQKRLEKRIKLLGASVETFFSAKCTHLVTPKTMVNIEQQQQQQQQQENQAPNDINKTRKIPDHVKDDIVEKAKKWNIKVWSLDYTINFLHTLIEPSTHGRRADEKKMLGRIYQEEKLFGLSTSSDGHSTTRPQYVLFRGHYCLVEDVTNVHRAPVIKEYTRTIMDKTSHDFPWPYLKKTPANKSPFSRIVRDKAKEEDRNNKKDQHKNNNQQAQAQNQQQHNQQQQQQENILPSPSVPTGTTTPIGTSQQTKDESPRLPFNRGDSNLRASGFHPSATTTTTTISRTTTSTTADMRRLTPTDSVNRLDKRMIENIPIQSQGSQPPSQSQSQQKTVMKENQLRNQAIKQSIQLQQNTKRREQQYQQQQLQKKMKEMDLGFCENCNKRFSNLEEHLKEDAHQAFIRDQNNFKELDDLLEKTRRQYKTVLPDHMRDLTDPSIDGKSVRYQSDISQKRKRTSIDMSKLLTPTKIIKQDKSPEDVKMITAVTGITDAASAAAHNNDLDGWGKYYDVFLNE